MLQLYHVNSQCQHIIVRNDYMSHIEHHCCLLNEENYNNYKFLTMSSQTSMYYASIHKLIFMNIFCFDLNLVKDYAQTLCSLLVRYVVDVSGY